MKHRRLRLLPLLLLVAGMTVGAGLPSSAAASPAPPTVPATGTLVVVPNEAPLLDITAGDFQAPAPPPTGSSVYLETRNGHWVRLTGSAVRGVTTGSTFTGRLRVPSAVGRQATRDAASPTASAVLGAASALETALPIATGSISAPATPIAASTPRAHSLDVAYLYRAGDYVPAVSHFDGLIRRMGDYWSGESGGQITSMALSSPVKRQAAPSGVDVCDAFEAQTYARTLFGFEDSAPYFAGNGRHLVILVPGSRCGSQGTLGLATGGNSIHQGGVSWSSVDERDPTHWDQIPFHEFGHNLGLSHSGQRTCTGGVVDAPLINNLVTAPCADSPYGDVYDVMGGPFVVRTPGGAWLTSNQDNIASLNATHRADLNALPIGGGGIRPIEFGGGRSQTVTVAPAASASGLRALQITDPTTRERLYVEYRYPTGRDTNTMYATYAAKTGNDVIAPGVRILRSLPTRHGNSSSSTALSWQDAGGATRMWWPAGKSLTTHTKNVTVRVNSTSPKGASVTTTFAPLPQFTTIPKPRISADGPPAPGTTLTAADAAVGSWRPAASTVSYQWLRDGVEIPYDTSQIHAVVSEDVGSTLSVRATGWRDGYVTASSVSDGYAVPGARFTATPTPVITFSGALAPGTALTAAGATGPAWQPPATSVAFQWLRNGIPITGADSGTYRVANADRGAILTVRATGSRAGFIPAPGVSAGVKVPAAPVGPKPKVTRLKGSSRYGTAINASLEAFPVGKRAPVLYLANASSWQDSVAASAAAEYQRGSMLLVPRSGRVPGEVLTRIKQLSPGRIVIVGDTRDIADPVIAQVKTAQPRATYSRISAGDVYDTSRKVTAYAFAKRTRATVWVVDGRTHGEATIASRAAGHRNEPVILIDGSKDALDSATQATLATLKPSRMFVIGGSSSVSPGIENQLKAATPTVRIGGDDQYATAIEINKIVFRGTTAKAYLVSGDTWLEATTIGVSATRTWTPVFLTKRACVPPTVLTDLTRRKTQNITAVGGAISISTPAAQLKPCR